jgi:hypothetical protein
VQFLQGLPLLINHAVMFGGLKDLSLTGPNCTYVAIVREL